MKTIGVIGLGSIGMRHARNLLALGCKVYGMDMDAAKERAALDMGCSPLPAGSAIDKECNGIVIAVPTRLHCDQLLNLSPRVPVLLEKPVGASMADAADIRDTLMLGEPIYVGNNVRFHSCVKEAKDALALGQIGSVTGALFSCLQYNAKPDYLRDGVVLNWGAHEVDLACYFLGPGKVIESYVHETNGHDDHAKIYIQHGEVPVSKIHVDYVAKPQERFFKIFGMQGYIGCDLERFTVEIHSKEGHEVIAAAGSFDDTYIEEMQAFLDAIDGKKSDILATGREGLACLELLLEAKRIAKPWG